jgi:hypothetical protein
LCSNLSGGISVCIQNALNSQNKDSLNKDSQNIVTESVVIQILTGLAAVIAIISAILSLSNPTNLFQIINVIQIFMLIVLLDLYLPQKVLNILNSMNYFTLSFEIPFVNEFSYLNEFYDYLDFLPPKADYQIIGIESGSSLINILCII